MVRSIFEDSRCGLPSFASRGYRLVDSCTVEAAPPWINDCADLDIPIDEPPVLTQPICPTYQVMGGVTVAPGATPAVVINTTQLGHPSVCNFLWDFDFSLPPAPCPVIGATASAAATFSNTPAATVGVTRLPANDSEHCPFVFDFNFDLPAAICPVFNMTTSVRAVAGPPQVDLVVTRIAGPAGSSSSAGDGNNCQFIYDWLFQLPGAICPSLTAEATATVAIANTPSVALTVTRTGPVSACNFMFDFDFSLPPAICPTIAVSATTALQAGTPAFDVQLTRLPATPSTPCNFLFDFDVTLPPAICPTIQAVTNTTTTTGGGAPTAAVTVTRTENASECDFLFDFDFGLPPAICPQLSVRAEVTVIDEEEEPRVDVTTTATGPSTACRKLVEFDFHIPVAIQPKLGRTTVLHPKNASRPVAIWQNGVDTGQRIPGLNLFCDIEANKWVVLQWIDETWLITAAEPEED